ncbi:hypothetical protein ACINKY_20755 [Paenibacillus illinoisensis]|uniref:Uncharacterized protein n=1 Tax=Paenibacillus illinoisensis TaxID=59845 RepID=A0ABW8HZG0_9BACL
MEEDNNKDDTFWELFEYLDQFKYSEELFDVSLNDEQRANFIFLGEKLRSNGWSFEKGVDLKWDVFESKVKGLIAES